ncbi:MAG: peptidase M14 family protein [Chlorobi bacterium]|nr:peptidase M14 family protein [Chlorobiota bacterium]
MKSPFRLRILRMAIPYLAVTLLYTTVSFSQESVTTPEKFFGYKMGADRQLARWDKIVTYFHLLETESDKIRVMDMGPSAEGHPFLIVLITSPENMADLGHLQEINKKISNPEGIPGETMAEYIKEGKAVIFQSMGLHSSEVASTQMTPELAYDLLTANDDDTKRILDNVLFFMIPCMNPDGEVMVTDWYNETKGTKYEGVGQPTLYHKYCGHDNNRDGDYMNLQESKYIAQAMYVDWPPQAYTDHHQMGAYGARFYVPPYCDPIRPWADPLVWREMSWYGAHIAYKLQEKGYQGVLNAAQYSGWGHFGWHWITPFHNIAGMLTESAGAKLATPIYIQPEQLKAGVRMFPAYEAQSTFPDPWQGGWWHVRDIVNQQKVAAMALLDMAARNRETVLETAYLKARNQTEKGAEGDVKALIIPADQHDYLTAVKMVNILLRSGIKITKASGEFTSEGKYFGVGSYVIPLAQPKMGLIRNLLMQTHYPDNAWTRKEDGAPLRPYDLATHTMAEFMGVTVEPVGAIPEGSFFVVTGQEKPAGNIAENTADFYFDGRQNASYKAANMLIDIGFTVKRVDPPANMYHPGDFVIEKISRDKLSPVARQTGVNFLPLPAKPEAVHTVIRGRTGLFQRYYGGNIDEGWTRLCFENYGFPYKTLKSEEIKKGTLNKKFDVIVIPDDSPEMITGIFGKESRIKPEDYPEKYRSGIGKEGTAAIKDFVNNGGTLVVLGRSWAFAAKTFDLSVRDVTKGLDSKAFFCPGSTVKVTFDNRDPLAYGMPAEGLVLFRNSPVFEILPERFNERYKTVVRYKKKDLLQSGWLDGEEHIAGKDGMIRVTCGKGEIVIIGFRTQHRDQTDGTFKLLFNSIIK